MPITPANRNRYPRDWPEISNRIRFDRARGRCEWCGAVHGSKRLDNGARVILTVHHLDEHPENCHDSNLVALCQRCHLRADRELHRRNAAATRLSKAQSPKQEVFPEFSPGVRQTKPSSNPASPTSSCGRPGRSSRPLLTVRRPLTPRRCKVIRPRRRQRAR